MITPTIVASLKLVGPFSVALPLFSNTIFSVLIVIDPNIYKRLFQNEKNGPDEVLH